MIQGAFARFDHHHAFEQDGGGTRINEVFDYTSPLGPLGLLADAVFLKPYMARFLMARLDVVKSAAESEAWQQYLSATS
jgi:ligand-binding SRPBCC domain-containing protein